MLKVLVNKTFDREFLSKFTWTGKSINGKVKLAFKNWKLTNDFLCETINTIDGCYSQSSYLSDIKKKILRYAYEHEQE